MKFSLKSYNDLGRCSMGTLLDEFDTDTFTIKDNGKVVEINSIEDLFPYLWQSPGCSGHSDGKHFAEFHGPGTHWHRDYDDRLLEYDKELAKLRKKIDKAPNPKRKAKYQQDLDWTIEHVKSLKNMIDRLDAALEVQKLKLIEDNK